MGQGDVAIERRIRTEVATPGRELGVANEALLTLMSAMERAGEMPDLSDREQHSINRFKNMARMIQTIVDEERAKRDGGLRDSPSEPKNPDGQ